MKYEIIGEPMPVVVCDLEANEAMITERGSMVWMSPNMKMETGAGGIGKAFGRMFSGESMFQNTYTAQGGAGMIAFASSFPGSIKAVEIDPAHGSKSELVGLVVLVLSLLLLLVLSILAIGLVLTILAAGLHLVRILILHQAHLAFADCSVPGKNKIIRKFFSQMGIPRAALLCYNEPS